MVDITRFVNGIGFSFNTGSREREGAKREGQGEGETTLNLSAPTQPTRLVKLVQRPRPIQLNHPGVPGPLPQTLTAPANKRLPLSAIRLNMKPPTPYISVEYLLQLCPLGGFTSQTLPQALIQSDVS